MLGLEEATHDVVLVAVIGAIGGIAVAVVQNFRSFRKTTAIENQLKTGNGHTAGEALGRLEFQNINHEQRLDRLEIKLSEHTMGAEERLARLDAKLDLLSARLNPPPPGEA